LVAKNGESLLPRADVPIINRFKVSAITTRDVAIPAEGTRVHVIVAEDGQLVTRAETLPVQIRERYAVSDTRSDVLKIVVVNRYKDAPVAIGFIKGFGLEQGALASSVAHDSHNIVAVGVDDDSIVEAVNMIIRTQGGVAAVTGNKKEILPLPIAGIMTNADGYRVAKEYEKLDALSKQMGSPLSAPFMTLSFMALLVIPALKLSDLGLFDGTEFTFKNLFAK
jgi:adenine deaminase